VSIVIGLAMENFIIMMSDGRVSKANTILKEDYKKLFRFNKNICIGFTGSQDLCESILNELSSIINEEIKLEQICDFLINSAIEKKNNIFIADIFKCSFLIGGISDTNEIIIYRFNSENNFILEKMNSKGTELSYNICSNTVDNKMFENFLRAKKICTSLQEYVLLIEEFIDKVAKIDPSVNTNKYNEIILFNV